MSTAESHSRWAIVVVAVFQFLTALVAWRTHITVDATKQVAAATEVQVNSIHKEVNSMREASEKAQFAAGKEEARAAAAVNAAALAEGQRQGRTEAEGEKKP